MVHHVPDAPEGAARPCGEGLDVEDLGGDRVAQVFFAGCLVSVLERIKPHKDIIR